MKHRCHFPPCTVEVPRKMFMCRTHWYMVPKPLRDEVWLHYNPGQEQGKAPVTREYLDVTDRAIAAVKAKIEKMGKEKAPQGDLFK